jgi:hypothetical protein
MMRRNGDKVVILLPHSRMVGVVLQMTSVGQNGPRRIVRCQLVIMLIIMVGPVWKGESRCRSRSIPTL